MCCSPCKPCWGQPSLFFHRTSPSIDAFDLNNHVNLLVHGTCPGCETRDRPDVVASLSPCSMLNLLMLLHGCSAAVARNGLGADD